MRFDCILLRSEDIIAFPVIAFVRASKFQFQLIKSSQILLMIVPTALEYYNGVYLNRAVQNRRPHIQFALYNSGI